MYNLTNNQKTLAKWLVQEFREGRLPEDFNILWIESMGSTNDFVIQTDTARYSGTDGIPDITKGALDALAANELILCNITQASRKSGNLYESSRRCTLTGKIYEAIDTDFSAPDTSFIKYLTPLADINGFDEELKKRCLPILGAGGSDPMLWDSVARTAGVILEERLRDVGSIADPNRIGRDLVNNVLGKNGTLASKFQLDAEREGYRDLYAGTVGAFRNPSAHRLIDPSPEEGGAFIVFINLLLKKLELLR
jgi:hypothetical protein